MKRFYGVFIILGCYTIWGIMLDSPPINFNAITPDIPWFFFLSVLLAVPNGVIIDRYYKDKFVKWLSWTIVPGILYMVSAATRGGGWLFSWDSFLWLIEVPFIITIVQIIFYIIWARNRFNKHNNVS